MERDQWYGQIIQNILEIGFMDMPVEELNSIMQKKILMKVNIIIINEMVLVNSKILKMPSILGIGKMICSMGKDKNLGPMVHILKDIIKKE